MFGGWLCVYHARLSSAHKLEFIVDKSIINYCSVRIYGMGVCVWMLFALCFHMQNDIIHLLATVAAEQQHTGINES